MKDLAVIETILRNRYHFFHEIGEGVGLPQKMRAMLISSVAFLALYGAVMGSTHSLWQALSSAVKLPLLFLDKLIFFAKCHEIYFAGSDKFCASFV